MQSGRGPPGKHVRAAAGTGPPPFFGSLNGERRTAGTCQAAGTGAAEPVDSPGISFKSSAGAELTRSDGV